MKIGVLSDSHDNMAMILAALELFEAERVEAAIHAGDIVAPFAAKLLKRFAGPLHVVYGNNDGEREGLAGVLPQISPGPLRVDLAGRRIIVHHWIEQVPPEATAGADVIITGHTHVIVNDRVEGRHPTLILNPGECCGVLTGRSTAAILDTDSLSARIVTLGEGEAWKV